MSWVYSRGTALSTMSWQMQPEVQYSGPGPDFDRTWAGLRRPRRGVIAWSTSARRTVFRHGNVLRISRICWESSD